MATELSTISDCLEGHGVRHRAKSWRKAMADDDIKARMKRRSVEIGRMLRNARTSRNVSISECAALIGTARIRYRGIESGESFVSVVELEVLMEHLGIPQEVPVPAGSGDERKIHRIPVSVSPDDTIYLVVDVGQSSG